jgi:hypothetical protein
MGDPKRATLKPESTQLVRAHIAMADYFFDGHVDRDEPRQHDGGDVARAGC